MNGVHVVVAARTARGQGAGTMPEPPESDEPPPSRKLRAPRNPGDPADAEMQRRFGLNLKAERDAAGLSQADVAKAAGMAQPDVAELEAGRKNATLRTMRRLAFAVGCELEFLLKRIADRG